MSRPPMPSDLPPLPEGFVYWGVGPLDVMVPYLTKDICAFNHEWYDNEWSTSAWTGGCDIHYALRAGSEIARLNGITAAEDEFTQQATFDKLCAGPFKTPDHLVVPKPLMASDMTMRDAFAAAALQSLATNPNTAATSRKTDVDIYEVAAICAYAFADAMLAERGRPSTEDTEAKGGDPCGDLRRKSFERPMEGGQP